MERHHRYHVKKPVYAQRLQELHDTGHAKWKKNIVFFLIVCTCASFVLYKKMHAHQPTSDDMHDDAQSVMEQSVEDVGDVSQSQESDAVDAAVVRHEVGEGDIPADIFSEYGGFDANDTAVLIEASEDVFDFTHVKIGQELRFYFDDAHDTERATRMEYDRNTEKMIIVERNGDDFTAREERIAYDVTETVAEGTIENFFYVDALDAGLSEATVLDVGDMFSFSIDFTTEIRTGDTFVFVYDKRMRDGKPAPDGYIRAAKFVNDGTPHYAYYFDNDGEGGYYDSDGHALERQFLKAPLSYRRITSGFTGARLHPITKKVSAHYQIDYAAPIGTPVVASARGRVMSARFERGWGNIVRIKHDNGYTTHYAHLSSFAKGMKSGAHVAQGELVGYVGSTGWSTGPHLDYGMRLNGAPVNPLTLVQPKGVPLEGEKMTQFKEMQQKYAEILQ
ncbi:MAG: hypothetical protein CR972_04470 [Candidatus Moraniibacteriota bacterium]|nr:MAG: hypothetical protein CR972_04470 [Candidatus Moranbacteria bacterium]